VIYQFAHALLYTHRSGVIHRDICPRNVLVDDSGRAILIDFGLSIPKLEKLKDVFYRSGTPSYMAPEVVRSGHYDFQTDIYAFGVSMYEIFTGQPPFFGGDDFDRAQKNLNTPVLPPHEVNEQVPEELSTIIMKALDKDPAQRYHSMEGLIQDLTRLIRSFNPSLTETTRVLLNDDTRRMHERIRESCYIHYTLKSWVSRHPRAVAVTENISGGGISFRVREPLEIGTNLQLEIQPRAGTNRIEATGKVVHIGDKNADGLTKIGVEFTKIPRKDRDRFQKYIQERRSASASLGKD
jgi:serine/threonine protein kinase